MHNRPPIPLKGLLALRGIKHREFALTVGISAPALSEVINRRRTPWPALRQRCAAALNVDESELFDDIDADGIARLAHSEVARQAAELVQRTTAEQGLPLKVEDAAVLADVAAVVRIHLDRETV